MPRRPEWAGSRGPQQKRCTPEMLALIVELLPTVGSLRDLCAITGLRLDMIRRETAPFLAIMKLNGTHPKCGCGRDRFHPYGCVNSRAKADHSRHVNGQSVAASQVFLERRRRLIEMLIEGYRFVDIDNALGLYRKSARKYLRFLTAEQLAERERRIAERNPEPKTERRAA